MDTELKCNRLTCRKPLLDKAVVTTCSHIFCVECANELFNSARLCPACETFLAERDDVVICSLNPTNDYRTSVLSGLSPSVILDVCNRAISFWQYQIHQETSFQQAVVRNFSDANTQLQKQLENVVREANGELHILNNKVSELDHDLELERRKVRDLQEASRDRDKEYQKLKGHYDKLKRKALLNPGQISNENAPAFAVQVTPSTQRISNDAPRSKQSALGAHARGVVDIGTVGGGMEVNGTQRTPLVNRTSANFTPQHQQGTTRPIGNFGPQGGVQWQPNAPYQPQTQARNHALSRAPFGHSEYSYRAATASDRSDSASEVEHLLNPNRVPRSSDQGWQPGRSRQVGESRSLPINMRTRTTSLVFAPPTSKRITSGFKPAR